LRLNREFLMVWSPFKKKPKLANLLERRPSFRDAAIAAGFSERYAEAIHVSAVHEFGEMNYDCLGEGDEIFLANILTIASKTRPGRSRLPRSKTSISHIGEDYDFIAHQSEKFSFMKALNWAASRCIKPKYQCALVATARNEGPFLVEWLAHQRIIGFDRIFLYTNDNDDGSDALLRRLAQHGLLTLVTNSAGSEANPQCKAYEHALHFTPELLEYQWVAFFDIDEFLILDVAYDFRLPNYLQRIHALYPEQLPAFAGFNWCWMGSAGQISRNDRRVTARFEYGSRTLQPLVKSVVRPSACLSMSPHSPKICKGHFAVKSSMVELSPAELTKLSEVCAFDASFEAGRLNHYWQKSFEEFLVKQTRGEVRQEWRRETELFFAWDVPTENRFLESFPSTLGQRIEAEINRIKNLKGVSACLATIGKKYDALSANLARQQSIQAEFEYESDRFRILKALEITAERQAPFALSYDPDSMSELFEFFRFHAPISNGS
jgi:hypothetical protein